VSLFVLINHELFIMILYSSGGGRKET